jgi:hypothetical protein
MWEMIEQELVINRKGLRLMIKERTQRHSGPMFARIDFLANAGP